MRPRSSARVIGGRKEEEEDEEERRCFGSQALSRGEFERKRRRDSEEELRYGSKQCDLET